MTYEKVTLTGAKETLLITLYARAVQTIMPDPILVDEMALRAVRSLDYDFRKIKLRRDDIHGIAARAKFFDNRLRGHLADHPELTVLHLGCGLDSRVWRVPHDDRVRWYDVDYPEVTELRERLFPRPDGDYHLVASSVTDLDWLREVPTDRPVLVLAEGLIPYLDKTAGIRLFRAITEHFDSGEFVFDAWSTLAVRMRNIMPTIRATGATMGWGINDPHDLPLVVEGLEYVDSPASYTPADLKKMSLGVRAMAKVPGAQNFARILRYRFAGETAGRPAEKITLSGTRETLLITLYSRAVDSRRPDPVLGDTAALTAIRRVDYDFTKLRVPSSGQAVVVRRGRILDDWTEEFLAAHPYATVLHLGCGLDTRVFRVKSAETTRWYDVDFPDVIELRRKLFHDFTFPAEYRTIGSSVADGDFLDDIPADQPVLMVAEGLTPYLAEPDVQQLLTRIVDHFPGGQLVFDAILPWVLKVGQLSPTLRATGATLGWSLDDPTDLSRLVPGLTFDREKLLLSDQVSAETPMTIRLSHQLARRFPAFGRSLRLLRYTF